MLIGIILFLTFSLSFLLLFILVYHGNKTEPENEKQGLIGVIFVAALLALLPTAVIALFLFILLGSANIVSTVFSLQISGKQLIILAVSLLIYLFTVDSIIEMILKQLLSKPVQLHILMLLVRIFAFHWIGQTIGIPQQSSFILAAGLAFVIFAAETALSFKERKKE